MNKKNYYKIIQSYIIKIVSIFVFCLLGMANVYAKNVNSSNATTFKQIKTLEVTINMNNKTLKEILIEICKIADIKYAIKDGVTIDNSIRYSLHVTKVTVESALTKLLDKSPYSYELIDGTLTIINKKVVTHSDKMIVIKGKILNPEKKPIVGATIIVEDSSRGAISDENGAYSLQLQAGGKINVSYIGFKSTHTIINESNFNLNIILHVESLDMDDVVVTGYQSIDRRDMIGSYSKVKMDDIMIGSYSNVADMLQGQVAGMLVTKSSPRAGATPKISIRGTSTVLGNQDPIWVVDGIIQDDPISFNATSNMADDMKNIIGNQVSWLNPNDIESITILKDASATAIYGSRASNGVIVVNLKKAAIGRTSINYSTNLSFKPKANYGQFNMMNSKERVQFGEEAFNAGVKHYTEPISDINSYDGVLKLYTDGKISQEEYIENKNRLSLLNTDWLDILTRATFSQNHNLSVSGASEKLNYSMSVGYNNEKGQEIHNSSERFTTRASIGVQLHKRLRVDLAVNASTNSNIGYISDVNPLDYATKTSRSIPAYNEDGSLCFYRVMSNYAKSYNSQSTDLGYNILNEIENSGSKAKIGRMGVTLNVKLKLLDWLSYEFVGGYNYSSKTMNAYIGEETFNVANRFRGYDYDTVEPSSAWFYAALLPFGGELKTSDSNQNSINIQNKILINKTFNQSHRLNIMAGVETRSSKDYSIDNILYGFIPDRGNSLILPTKPELFNPIGATSSQSGFGILERMYNGGWKNNEQTNNYFSIYATAAYSYENRYVINANIRNDASNRFGQDTHKRFDPTYSFGLLWRITEEPFLKEKINWLTSLAFKATYGIQGNVLTNISPDLILELKEVKNIYNEYYSTISSIPNPNLSWESTKSWNYSVDMRLFDAINIVADYYTRNSNVVIMKDIPFETGMNNMALNGGEVLNSGVELTIGLSPINTKTFGLSFSVNSSRNWNKTGATTDVITRDDFINGSTNRILKDGYPLSAIWAYDYTGLSAENGMPLYNFHEDTYNSEDPSTALAYVGQFTPVFTGGLNLNIRYKNLTFGANFSLLWGGNKRLTSPYSQFEDNGRLPLPSSNLNRDLTNRWKSPGDENYTDIPGFITNQKTMKTPFNDSDQILEVYKNSTALTVKSSFLRCGDIRLGYRLNSRMLAQIGLKNLSVNASMNNAFVIASKKFKGFDPELDNSVMPRVFSLGINVGF